MAEVSCVKLPWWYINILRLGAIRQQAMDLNQCWPRSMSPYSNGKEWVYNDTICKDVIFMNWLAFKWWMTSLQHEDYFSKAYKFHWLFPNDKIMSEWVILIYTVQIMTCCLMSPSHLMEQFRVIFSMDCSELPQTIYQVFPNTNWFQEMTPE